MGRSGEGGAGKAEAMKKEGPRANGGGGAGEDGASCMDGSEWGRRSEESSGDEGGGAKSQWRRWGRGEGGKLHGWVGVGKAERRKLRR